MRIRAGTGMKVVVVAATVSSALVAAATPAVATGGTTIAGLAAANVGRGACSTNSLGGQAYDSSCTGDGGQPEYWCADFARWVWANAGVADTSELSAAAGSFYLYGARHGTLSAFPAVGDAEIFDYASDGYAEHVAIVTKVNPNGTIESISGDWDGRSGTETEFSSTSAVVANTPAYAGELGEAPDEMGMTISGFVAPVGVAVDTVVAERAKTAGRSIPPGGEMTSPDHRYALRMQADGNLVEYLGGRTLWSTGTQDHPGASAVMQSDGNLVVYSDQGDALWSSATSGHPGSRLVVADDGVVSVTDGTGSHWSVRPRTDMLGEGSGLASGQELVSGNGLNQLVVRSDGDVVEYTAGRELWSSGTAGHPDARLFMRPNGNLVVFSDRSVVWQSNTAGRNGAVADLRDDGALTVGGTWSNGV